ncbi:hypothetical protein ES702_01073 [subsurface metagenome]
MTPAQLAIIAGPEVTFLYESQHLEASHTSQSLQDFPVNTATVPVMFNQESINEAIDAQRMPALTNITTAPQNGEAPSTQPPPDNNASNKAIKDSEEKQQENVSKNKDKKRKPAPRFDRMYKCESCNSRDMELTAAKAHVTKKHEGCAFYDIMVRRPNKERKVPVAE